MPGRGPLNEFLPKGLRFLKVDNHYIKPNPCISNGLPQGSDDSYSRIRLVGADAMKNAPQMHCIRNTY